MVTYVYECPDHGRFEVVKPMVESAREERCPFEPWMPRETRNIATKVITPPAAIHANGSSGDGYLFDSKTGLRSGGRRFREV